MSDRIMIIPALNEKKNLQKLVPAAMRCNPGWDVLVVDDGSADGTSEWLLREGISHLRLPFTLGIGGAMHAGYRWAHEQGYLYALQLDGDGQHPPEEVANLFDRIHCDGADMVIGARFAARTCVYRQSLLRMFGIRLFRVFIRSLTGATVADPTSGFRLVNRRVMKLFSDDYPSDYPEVETLVQLLLLKYVVREVPVVMQQRQHGKTSINALDSIVYMLKVPFAIFLKYRSMYRSRVCCGSR